MRYCSGSGFELLSDSDVMAVCQDSKVFLIRQLALSTKLIAKIARGVTLVKQVKKNIFAT